MKEIIEFAAIIFSIVVNHIFSMYRSIKHPDDIKSRTVFEIILSRWTFSLASIFVVVLVAINQSNGIASIGINISNKSKNIAGMILGYFGIAVIFLCIKLFTKFIIRKKASPEFTEQDLKRPELIETIKFNGKMERFLYLSTMSFVVIAEDFTYRGYLVLLLGNRTGSFIPWATFSVLLSVIIHLYQSRNWKTILSHFLYACFFVGITIITQNIFASITAHLINNVGYSIVNWKRADKQGISNIESQSNKGILLAWFLFAGLNYFALFVLFAFIVVS